MKVVMVYNYEKLKELKEKLDSIEKELFLIKEKSHIKEWHIFLKSPYSKKFKSLDLKHLETICEMQNYL